jgi:uncharacterized membrane protein
VVRAPWWLSRFWFCLGAVTLVGAVMRLATLGHRSFWLDEGVTYIIAVKSVADLLSFIAREDVHPPLYYLVLHAWLAGGDSEVWLRLPSATFGIVSIVLLGVLGRHLVDERTGVIAALAFAISPLQVWYAQEARMYALVVLLALIMLLCLWQAINSPPRPIWWWAGVTVSGTLVLYTSTSGVWLLAGLNLFLLVYATVQRRWRLLAAWVVSQVAMVTLFLPWLPSQVNQLAISQRVAFWVATPTIGAVTNLLADFNSRNLAFWFRASLDPVGTELVRASPWQALGPVNLAFIGGILAAALVVTLRQHRPAHWLLWCLLVAPIGLAYLLSQPSVTLPFLANDQSVFTVKNLLIASLPYYLFVGLVLGRGPRWFVIGGLATLVGLNLVSFHLENELRGEEDWRGVAATVAPLAQPDDLIVFTPGYIESPYAYYTRARAQPMVTRGYPVDDLAVHTPPRANTVAQLMTQARRIWLVEAPRHQPQSTGLAEALLATGSPAWQQDWRGITVRRFDR